MGKISTDHHVNITKLIELLTQIREEEGDLDIVLSRDEEGNGFSPLTYSASVGWYIPQQTWFGEFHSDGNIEEDPEEYEGYGFDEYGVRAMVLWPVN